MNLKDLKDGDKFSSASGVLFSVLKMTRFETKQHKDRIKCLRHSNKIVYFLTSMSVSKIKSEADSEIFHKTFGENGKTASLF